MCVISVTLNEVIGFHNAMKNQYLDNKNNRLPNRKMNTFIKSLFIVKKKNK